MLGVTDILPLVCQISPQYLEHLLATTVFHSRGDLVAAVRTAAEKGWHCEASPKREVFVTLSSTPIRFWEFDTRERLLGYQPQRFAADLHTLALARQLWRSSSDAVFLNQVNLFSRHDFLRPSKQKRETLVPAQALHIVENGVGVLPVTGKDPRGAQLRQGVLDTVAAATLMEAACCGKVENAAQVFEAATALRIARLTVRDKKDSAWQAADLPPDVRALVERELNEGNTVVIPSQAVALDKGVKVTAWYRINPETGQTLGVAENGWAGPLRMDEVSQIEAAVRTLRGFTRVPEVAVRRSLAWRVRNLCDFGTEDAVPLLFHTGGRAGTLMAHKLAVEPVCRSARAAREGEDSLSDPSTSPKVPHKARR